MGQRRLSPQTRPGLENCDRLPCRKHFDRTPQLAHAQPSQDAPDSYLTVDSLQIHYGKRLAVKDLSLAAKRGEFLTLLGPSGCGKTTTLRAIAGFVAPSGGNILVAGQDITALPAHRRNIGMV